MLRSIGRNKYTVIFFIALIQILFIIILYYRSFSFKNTTNEEFYPLNTSVSKEIILTSVRFPFINQKITAEELEKTLPSSIVLNCHFCDYPVYEKAYVLINGELSYVTAFLKSVPSRVNGTELVILSYTPHTFWNKKLEYKHHTKEVVVKIISSNGQVEELNDCLSTKTYKAQYITSIHCSIDLTEELHKDCFHVHVKEILPEKRDLLNHPIPIRHCELPLGTTIEKSNVAMVCLKILFSKNIGNYGTSCLFKMDS